VNDSNDMTCTEVERGGVAEGYLLGRLSDEDREAYERHYFECSRCYAELEALGALREALVRPPRRAAFSISARWLAVAATLTLTVAAALVWQARQPRDRTQPAVDATGPVLSAPSPSPNLEEIARLAVVAPPPYSPSRFRDAGERTAFTQGMRRYVEHDFNGAIPPLERAVRESPSAEDARFYLGAAYLLAGRSHNALSTLEPSAADTRSPYAEEAQFLIAKANIQSGNLPGAVAALDKTVAMHGDREQEARTLRAHVAALAPAR
jgi:tetratricopeptide (TPR) repeat protein